jgi:acyl carrier protein
MNTEPSEIFQALRQFIVEHSNLEDDTILQEDTDLFEVGVLDSLMAVSLVSFCEERFSCEIDLSELSQENFSSLNTLVKFVRSNLEARLPN